MEHVAGDNARHGLRKLTEETAIKGHRAAASEAEPRYLVESDETGAEAAPKPGALTRISGSLVGGR